MVRAMHSHITMLRSDPFIMYIFGISNEINVFVREKRGRRHLRHRRMIQNDMTNFIQRFIIFVWFIGWRVEGRAAIDDEFRRTGSSNSIAARHLAVFILPVLKNSSSAAAAAAVSSMTNAILFLHKRRTIRTQNALALCNVHWLNKLRPIKTKRMREHAVQIQIGKQMKISSSLLSKLIRFEKTLALLRFIDCAACTKSMQNYYEGISCPC